MELNKKKLHVTNIDYKLNESILKNEFQRYGECYCKFVTDKNNSRNKYAFISYKDEYNASSALSGMNKRQFGSRSINVKHAKMTEEDRDFERKQHEREEEKRIREKEKIQQNNEVNESKSYSKTTIIIHNIPNTYTDKRVKKIFKKYNPTSVIIIESNYQKQMKGNPNHQVKMKQAFIEFTNTETQELVLNEMKDFEIEGKKINPKKAFEKDDKMLKNNEQLIPSETKVSVENIPKNYSKKQVKQEFEKYNPIKVTMNKQVIIAFESHEVQQKVIEEMNGKTIENNTITVKVFYEQLYEIVEKKTIKNKIKKSIQKVSQKYFVTEDDAILLLKNNKWNSKKISKVVKANMEASFEASGIGIESIKKSKEGPEELERLKQQKKKEKNERRKQKKKEKKEQKTLEVLENKNEATLQPVQMQQVPIQSCQMNIASVPINSLNSIQNCNEQVPVFRSITPVSEDNVTSEDSISEEMNIPIEIKPTELITVEKEAMECPICMETTTEFIGLSCGHKFCKSCWHEHIQSNANRGIILNMKCMESGCNCIVTRNIISFASKSLLARYNEMMLKDYVQSNGNLFCPNPSCNKIIILNHNKDVHTIRCKCNQRFCAKCHGEYHTPATCEEIDKWEAKNSEIDNDDYLMLTIKHCFHCGCPSERISGCNHITCPRCHKEWCWMCEGDWSGHGSSTGGWYSCNIYDAGNVERYQKDAKAETKKKDYERYMHYFNGYLNNNQTLRSLQIDKQAKTGDIEKRFKENKNHMKKLEESFNTLFMAKAWLKNSYIHLFYQDENSDKTKELLTIQTKIETESEQLSELLFDEVKNYNVQFIELRATKLKEELRATEYEEH